MSMPALTIVAKVVAKRECVEAVKAKLLKLIVPTRSEEGCIEYTLHQDNADPCVFIFHENWQSPVSLENHMNSDHFTAYITAVDGMIAEKTVYKMTRVEPGGEA